MRLVKGWRGAVLAWWAVIGLFVTNFAFIGVNMFLTGLHSYGTPKNSWYSDRNRLTDFRAQQSRAPFRLPSSRFARKDYQWSDRRKDLERCSSPPARVFPARRPFTGRSCVSVQHVATQRLLPLCVWRVF